MPKSLRSYSWAPEGAFIFTDFALGSGATFLTGGLRLTSPDCGSIKGFTLGSLTGRVGFNPVMSMGPGGGAFNVVPGMGRACTMSFAEGLESAGLAVPPAIGLGAAGFAAMLLVKGLGAAGFCAALGAYFVALSACESS